MIQRARERRDRTAWTIVLAAGSFLTVVSSLGLVSPRPRHAAEPPGATGNSLDHEPPPSPLVVPRPLRDGDRTSSPRTLPAGESALVAVDAGGGPHAPLPASLFHAPELARLEIRVSRAGRPEPDATIELVHERREPSRKATPWEAAPAPSLHRSDADGMLCLELAPGSARVVAWSADACALPAEAALEVGVPARLELELEPAFPVTGRVLDALSGAPVAGATVALWTFAERDVVTTAADGTFRHPRFPARAPAQQIAARAEGYGLAVRYLRIDPEGNWKLSAATRDEASRKGSGTPWVELLLAPEVRVRGRVLATDGLPIAGARISAEGFFHALPSVASRDGATTTSDGEGVFALAGLRSDVGHSLALEAEGCALELVELAARTGEIDLGSVTLVRESVLAGVAIDLDGLPMEDVEVVLRIAASASGPTNTLPNGPLDVGVRLQGRELRTRTTPEGTFLFAGLAPRSLNLVLEHPSGACAELALEPRPDGGFDSPCLVLAPPSLASARRP